MLCLQSHTGAYLNLYQKNVLIIACASHLAFSTSKKESDLIN